VLRFTNLGSGSSGNATLIEALPPRGARPTRVLVDCGLSPRQLANRLATRGLLLADIDAVFITHEHSDHVGSVLAVQRRHGMPVWASAGTWAQATARLDDAPPPCLFARDGEAIVVGAITVLPFAVPHDAAEPLQLTCSDGQHRIGILTDIGEPTDAVVLALQGCDALLLETNHDPAMLAAGAYPAWLKRRIGGHRGHLSNEQSAALLEACCHDDLRHVVAAHLSQQNNRPELALAALRSAVGELRTQLTVADAVTGCAWIEIG